MATNNSRINSLDGYRQYLRDLRNGTAVFNDDATEQMHRTLFGYEDTLRGHEQWNRERRQRFAEDAENIGRVQGLQSNALALDAQRRTHESGIASGLAKAEREQLEDRLAMRLARQSLDILDRQRDDDAIIRKSVSFEALGQALSGRRVSRDTLDRLNAIREKQEDGYDPNVDDITGIGIGENGQLQVTYASGDVLPWQDYRTLLSFGRQNPDFDDVIEANLPKQIADQHRLDRAAKIDLENQERQQAYQERQQAYQERAQRRQELSSYMQNAQKLIAQYDDQIANARDQKQRDELTRLREGAYGNLVKAMQAFETANPDVFTKDEESADKGVNEALTRAIGESNFYGNGGGTVYNPGNK